MTRRHLVLALNLALWLTSASATLRTITVEGSFGQQHNDGYFGLALPIPFHFFVQYDDQAQDSDPNSNLGVYETEGAYSQLHFGGYPGFSFNATNTEVRVWNGKDGIKGISFGNEDAFSAHGLYIEPYRMYALFPNLFYTVAGWNDSLHWIADMAGDYRFEALAYVFLFGHTETPAWTETSLQTTSAQRYRVD